MDRVDRGKVAAVTAAAGVALAALAVVQAVAFAASGAYLLLVAPVVGLPVACGIHRALHRRCTTGSARAIGAAAAGVVVLATIAIVGVSFGGLPLLLPATLLALATALTPRPALTP